MLQQLNGLADRIDELLPDSGSARKGRHQPISDLEASQAATIRATHAIRPEGRHDLDRELGNRQRRQTFDLRPGRFLLSGLPLSLAE
jgi:hypothetical protein